MRFEPKTMWDTGWFRDVLVAWPGAEDKRNQDFFDTLAERPVGDEMDKMQDVFERYPGRLRIGPDRRVGLAIPGAEASRWLELRKLETGVRALTATRRDSR